MCRKCELAFICKADHYPMSAISKEMLGSIDHLRECRTCGQVWWCYNDHFNLCTTVDDLATIENIKKGCPEPTIIAFPAVMIKG